MKRATLKRLTPVVVALAVLVAGCGDDAEPPADPQAVIEAAFPGGAVARSAAAGAEVEVAALGFEDRVLESKLLSVAPATYADIRGVIRGSNRRGAGLFGLADRIETVGTEDLDGVEVDHVTGDFNITQLVDQLEEASSGAGAGVSLPGVGELDQIRDSLVAADFDLYANSDDGGFERLDLTLSVDDRENASPPTRIRFSLTESDPSKATG